MKNFLRLSQNTIENLKKVRQSNENDTSNSITTENMKYALSPLSKRGLIGLRKKVIDNKVLYCIYLSEDGAEYLRLLEGENKDNIERLKILFEEKD